MIRSVRTSGFKDLHAALGDMKNATANNVLRRAGMAALEPVAEVMRDLAPVQAGGDEDLKTAIGVGTKRSKRARKQFKSSKVVEVYAGVGVVKGSMPPQATQQEFGNQNHGPQPYVRPAWDQEQDATLDRVRDSIGEEIEKAAARAARKAARAR